MDCFSNEQYLEALKTALCGAKVGGYSLLKRREWKTCLLREDQYWKVAFIEHGQEVDPIMFESVSDVCFFLIERVTYGRKRYRVKQDFLKRLRRLTHEI